MPTQRKKHPAIRAIAILAIIGGLLTMGRSLMLLQTALEQQRWPSATVLRDNADLPQYRVGEREFGLPPGIESSSNLPLSTVFYDPDAPDHVIPTKPNFWWPLYLSMAGLIVFYAGLHLLREKDRGIGSLGFE